MSHTKQDLLNHVNLLNELTRVSPASNQARFTELCDEYDYNEDDSLWFYEAKAGDRLVTKMMFEPVDIIVVHCDTGITTYHGSDDFLSVTEHDANDVLCDLALYRKVA